MAATRSADARSSLVARADLVLAKRARSLPSGGVRMWRHVPNRRHRHVVDLPHFGQRQERIRPSDLVRADRLPVDPLGCRTVSLYLQVLAEFLVADRQTFCEQLLHLLQHQRVSLDRGGVMSLLIPDAPPDIGRLQGSWQAAQTPSQVGNIGMQTAVQLRPGGSPSAPRLFKVFAHSGSNCTVQNRPRKKCTPVTPQNEPYKLLQKTPPKKHRRPMFRSEQPVRPPLHNTTRARPPDIVPSAFPNSSDVPACVQQSLGEAPCSRSRRFLS